ncbi:unnamed protein product [Amoebophrya sp. A120]|nr:unnamed protein product [Amoebophrya sp. A120]|eukprot:GSA120T00010792001.1
MVGRRRETRGRIGRLTVFLAVTQEVSARTSGTSSVSTSRLFFGSSKRSGTSSKISNARRREETHHSTKDVKCIMPTVFPKNTYIPRDDTRKDEFDPGYELQLACQKGFVGEPPKMVCQEAGYFKTVIEEYGCVPKPRCPAPRPENHNAVFANITDPVKGAQYQCAEGYSLDGRDGGSYGAGHNMFFWVKCDIVNEVWEDWAGKCQEVQINEAEAFKSVFQILFNVDCKNGVLRPSLFKAKSGPDYGKKMCAGAPADAKGTCDGLVTTLESAMKADWENRETAATEFCEKMWTEVIGGDTGEQL